jgi:hypothetical protein
MSALIRFSKSMSLWQLLSSPLEGVLGIFFKAGNCGVLLGFWENEAKKRGVLVVNLW